jgi:hypothetical protein
MAERDPIDLIREQLGKADGVAGLHPDHESFKQWQTDTKRILEKAFGSKSIHFQSFAALRFQEVSIKAFASPEIDRINAARYRKDLENAKNILHGAIKELTVDRTLFRKLQTTPTTVEISVEGEYFLSSGIQDPQIVQAVEAAFEGSGLKPGEGRGKTLRDRIDQIRGARLGIYDLSNPEKAEIFLEVGAALAMEKEVILICKKGAAVPEPLKSVPRIEYGDLAELTEKLRKKMGTGR